MGENYFKPHPVPENSYGKTYGEHRDKLEFSIKQHLELKNSVKNKIGYSTSVILNLQKKLTKVNFQVIILKFLQHVI